MKKTNLNKKALLFVVTCLVNTPVLPNKIQDAVQEIYDEVVPQNMKNVDQQLILIGKFGPATWYETLIWADPKEEAKREVVRRDPEAKKFLEEFFTLNAQALGIFEIKECLDMSKNPSGRDLDLCRIKWLQSRQREYALETVAASNEKAFKITDHSFTDAFHEGNRRLEKQIRSIIKENTEEQN